MPEPLITGTSQVVEADRVQTKKMEFKKLLGTLAGMKKQSSKHFENLSQETRVPVVPREQRLPRQHQFDLGKEDFAPGLLPPARLLRIRKTELTHCSCAFAGFSHSARSVLLTFPKFRITRRAFDSASRE